MGEIHLAVINHAYATESSGIRTMDINLENEPGVLNYDRKQSV